MPDQAEAAVNAGEQITNTPPASLALKPEDQFRLINQRLEALAGEISHLAKPPQFRSADVISLLVIVLGLVAAGFTAFGLGERISDLRADMSASELRLKDNISGAEVRLNTKLDKLSDQFTSMDERTARLEGQQSTKQSAPR